MAEEIRDRPTVVDLHPGAEGVEDPNDDANVDPVVAVVRHGHRFGEALGFVVDPTDADGVDVAPVGLGLGIDLGVAVALRGARQQEARALLLGQTQSLVGSERADLENLDGKPLEVRRARGRSEVEDRVEGSGDVEVVGDVVVLEGEVPMAQQGLDILHAPGQKVVEGNDFATVLEELLTKVRTEKARPAGDQDSLQISLRGHLPSSTHRDRS